MCGSVSLFTWSGAQKCSTQSWARWWVLLSSSPRNEKAWGWMRGLFICILAFSQAIPEIRQQFSLCVYSVPSNSLPSSFLFPSILPSHTHTPLPVFWQLQGAVTEWVCVSLFVTKMGFGWMDGGILEEKCNHKKSDREKDGLLPLWASSQLGGGYRR